MRRMHEYGDWQIGVTAREGTEPPGRWTASIEVFPASKGPRTHTGVNVPFADWFGTAEEAEGTALRRAQEWLDRHGKALV